LPFPRESVGYQTDRAGGLEDNKPNKSRERQMITDEFNERTVANMEIALERACQRFPNALSSHEARKKIAIKIVERAMRGERTLKGLTDAAIMASAVLLEAADRPRAVSVGK
jgi:hypothetical protein